MMMYRIEWTRRALIQRCRHDQEWWFGRWTTLTHWWVTVKCIAAIWIGREAAGLDMSSALVVAYGQWGRTFDGELSGAAGETLYGAREGLGYKVAWDSWP